ncbi:MAG: FAD-dependent monooxygenase [Candidatus Rokubacteria bacterium]|nr:FAD-dependent monooxygenase [Candidatus Rokubacteria bacterium]
MAPTTRYRRDLIETTPQHAGCLDFYHPEMQRVLLGLAESVGAEVRTGVAVTAVVPGKPPAVLARANGQDEQYRARLVVGADGRSSRVRAWAGFPVKRDPERLVIAGVLHAGLGAPEDSVQVLHSPSIGQGALVFPIGRQRFRSYFIYRKRGTPRALSGRQHAADFVTACVETGAPPEWYRDAEVAGPLAAFEAADIWVEHPHRQGVALIGDSAAASDPSWGCGLSLTLRDVRVLRDQLLAKTDWEAAAGAYAEEHDRYYGALHRLEGWFTELLYEVGAEADARRARVFPRLAREPKRTPDVPGLGPDAPNDEAARRLFFVED